MSLVHTEGRSIQKRGGDGLSYPRNQQTSEDPFANEIELEDSSLFAKPVVFIVGAGASVDYGMPLGTDLVSRIASNVDHDQHFPVQ